MNYTHKIVGSVLSVAMLATAVPVSQVCAGQVIYDCDTGTEDGYNYKLWKDYGNTKNG